MLLMAAPEPFRTVPLAGPLSLGSLVVRPIGPNLRNGSERFGTVRELGNASDGSSRTVPNRSFGLTTKLGKLSGQANRAQPQERFGTVRELPS